jgi:hypothetical protein
MRIIWFHAAIVVGFFWLWINTPTYNQLEHPMPELAAIFIGLALVVGGLFGVISECRMAFK